jgi:hypothetical protein
MATTATPRLTKGLWSLELYASQILQKSEFPSILFNFFISRPGKIMNVRFKMYNKKIKTSASTKENRI